MTTSPSTDYVTRTEFERAMAHIDTTFDTFVTKSEFQTAMERIDTRFERIEERFDTKLDVLEARLERSIERATVTSIGWSVGLAMSQYALIVGVILFFISREIPHG